MYSVSNDYKTAIATDPVHTSVELRFWINGSLAFTMYDRNIIAGSLSIQKQCMNNDGFGLGGVYAGEMNVTLIPDDGFDVFDYDVADAEIRVIYKMGLYKQNGAWVYENIPLGRFLVDTVDFREKCCSIVAYDKMLLFDSGDISTEITGNAYQVVNALCGIVGVTLEQSSSDFLVFANYDKTYVVDPEQVDNCRDALSYICTMIGCFATMSRTGELSIRSLWIDYTDHVDNLSKAERLSSLLAFGKTKVKRVRGRFMVAVEDEKGDTKYEYKKYKANTGHGGGILDLGDCPLLREDIQTAVNVLATAMADVDYTSAQWETISNPIYDLGDILRLGYGSGQDAIKTILTSVNWKYHGRQESHSAGKNLGTTSHSTKSMSVMDSVSTKNVKSTTKEMIYILPTETDSSGIADGQNANIITFEFTAKKNKNDIVMNACVGFEVATTAVANTTYGDCVLTVTYVLDNTVVATMNATYGDGHQILALNYLMQDLSADDHMLCINFAVSGGSIS